MIRKPLPPTVLRIFDGLLLLLSGAGLGILMGLSVSPVLHIIVASVVAVVAGIVSTLAGLQIIPNNNHIPQDSEAGLQIKKGVSISRISPLPVTVLIVGLVGGACSGIYMRTNELFGTDPQKIVAKWKDTGIEEKEVRRRIFDRFYPATDPQQVESRDLMNEQAAGIQADSSENNVTQTERKRAPDQENTTRLSATQESRTAGLFAFSVSDCQLVALKHGDELRARLLSLNNKRINASIEKCQSSECLEAIKELLCSR